MSPRQTLEDVNYTEELSLFGRPQVTDFGDGNQEKFYGKYRGTVISNIDPEFQCRLLVQVIDVLGLFTSSWAMPCVPFAGPNLGQYSVPPIGAGVWIEFEQGNPQRPIWVGCFWGSAANGPTTAKALAPVGPMIAPTMLVQTAGQNAIAISDGPFAPYQLAAGGIAISSGPSSIVVDKTGIRIMAPSIIINGATVFNGGALAIAL
jgi:hypothetical protein